MVVWKILSDFCLNPTSYSNFVGQKEIIQTRTTSQRTKNNFQSHDALSTFYFVTTSTTTLLNKRNKCEAENEKIR